MSAPAEYNAYTGEGPRMAPHVYAVAQDAFMRMKRDGMNQAILVSGDSGSGKVLHAVCLCANALQTETTKIILDFLVTVSSAVASDAESGMARIGEKIVQSNPVLEAFGNAKTLFNDNSSRFGKVLVFVGRLC
jgi:myosin heavy subunit